jgi:hypothetical protein
LQGRIRLTLTPEKNHIKEDTDWLKNELSKGGIYQPPSCKSKERVAIIIPFRDREEHLKIFLRHMHPFLQRQKLEYGIYVIELVSTILVTYVLENELYLKCLIKLNNVILIYQIF